MVNVALAAELQRLLAAPPYGALSAMARSLGLTSASVSAWKYGQATPERDRWRSIEEYLGLPKDHLQRANRGVVDERVKPAWPGVAVTPLADLSPKLNAQRIDQLVVEMEQLHAWRDEAMMLGNERQGAMADLVDQLAAVRAELESLAERVASLEGFQRRAG